MREGESSIDRADVCVSVDREMASTGAQARAHDNLCAAESAQVGPTPVADRRLASLPKTLHPVLFLGGLTLAAWAVVAPLLAALAWVLMIAYAA